MTLGPGTRLGTYEIIGPIGAGGMGEVYRARDAKLQRDVAIKVLPELVASDTERVQRFEREAQTLAALNHPNIAQVHGVIESPPALIMELVEGPELTACIGTHGMPLDEALPVARQIAEALEAAHERGIVHRDLKPANIKVRADGAVKVLDFGLAKALGSGPGSAGDPMNSPTITSPAAMTRMGVILGTAAYMAPEQARGKAIDRGADLWAFGAVLFEMLTGKKAFTGETVTDVLAAIVTREPDWAALPKDTPAPIIRLLRRCLERDRRRRLSDAAEARFQIEEVLNGDTGTTAAAPGLAADRSRRLPSWLPWGLFALACLALGALGFSLPRQQPPVARYNLDTPPRTLVSSALRPAVAISPDGNAVVFVGSAAGVDRLFLRRIEDFDAAEIPGTQGASNPVFSPDGGWVAFFVNGSKLMKVSLAGGPPVQLDEGADPATQVSDPRGLSWSDGARIVYTPQSVGGVVSVSANGGARTTLTRPVANVERTHRWAQLLPGGKAIIYTLGPFDSPDNYDNAKIEALRLDTGEKRTLATGAMARYVDGGYLLVARGTTLHAVRFDPASLEVKGTPVAILQELDGDSTTGAAHFATSGTGALVYLHAASSRGNLRPGWMNTGGQFEPLSSMPPATYSDPRISPDGQHLALSVVTGGLRNIFVHNFARGTTTRRTFGGQNITPVWSRDGRVIFHSDAQDGALTMGVLRRLPVDGSSGSEVLARLDHRLYLADVMPDGQVLYDATSATTSRVDIMRIQPIKDAKPQPVVKSEHDELTPRLSPDGQWIAYDSDASGISEIYVRRVAATGGLVQVSTGGGEEPKWSPDGTRLYYRAGSQLFAVTVDRRQGFEVSTPQIVLTNVYGLSVESNITYDVHPRTGRLLMIRPVDETVERAPLRLVTNWLRELDAALRRSP